MDEKEDLFADAVGSTGRRPLDEEQTGRDTWLTTLEVK
jgi:hypothetical protein